MIGTDSPSAELRPNDRTIECWCVCSFVQPNKRRNKRCNKSRRIRGIAKQLFVVTSIIFVPLFSIIFVPLLFCIEMVLQTVEPGTGIKPKPDTPARFTPITLQVGMIVFLLVLVAIAVLLSRALPGFSRDMYSRSEDLSSAFVQPGLNIDNLPAVKIDYGAYKPSENTGDEEETGGNDPEESIAERRIRCLTRGVYLGEQNQYVNCVDYCRISSEEEVRYVYLSSTQQVIAGRTPLSPGAWCLPTAAASCNLNSALVVYSLNGWLCIPKTDALVGEGGNKIAVCDGSLWDNALQTRYDGFIPANLYFNDFYEDKLSDGRYRFQCLPNLKDDIKNKYLFSPFNRFHLLQNWCVQNIPFAKETSVPDFKTGKCTCDPPYGQLDNTQCTACRVGFDEQTFTFNLRVQPCFSVRDYISFLTRLRNQMWPDEILRPCGLDENESTTEEVTRPRCVVQKVGVFSPVAPSPNTMRLIRSKIGL